MKIPSHIPSGTDIRTIRNWLNQLRDAVASNVLTGDQQTFFVQRSAMGTRGYTKKIDAPRGGGGGGATGAEIKIAKITAKTDTWTYTANIFSVVDAGGQPTGTPDETGATIKILTDTLASGETVPSNTVIQVRKIDWGGTEYWTAVEHIGLM